MKKKKQKRNWKQSLSFILLLIVSGFIGFTGLELLYAIPDLSLWDFLLAFVVLVISFPLHIILHEVGHLIAGLLSGYQFIMFRLFNWVWIKTEDGISRRKQRVPGLLGQALMMPPNGVDNPPMFFYQAGGLLMNALTALFMIGLAWQSANPRATLFLLISASIALLLFVMNTIPQKGNDGYNMLQIYQRPEMADEVINLLRLYGGMVQGKSFTALQKYIPSDLGATFGNPNTVTFFTAQAAVYFEQKKFEQARKLYERLWLNRKQLLHLHRSEVYFNYLFSLLLTELEHEDVEKIKETQVFKNNIEAQVADAYKIRAAEAIYLEEDFNQARQLLAKGEKLIATAPTITEENVERQLYAYLRQEIERLENE